MSTTTFIEKNLRKDSKMPNESANFSGSGYLNYLYPLLLILIFFKAFTYIYDEKINLGGDNADYYLLGKAIAKGEGYVNIMDIDKKPAYHFPPGYPMIIGAVMTISGYDISNVKVANGIFLLGTVLLLFFLFKDFIKDKHLAFVASFLVLLNGTMLSFSTYMYSEVPFLFFVVLSFFFFLRIKDYDNFYKDYNFYLFLGFSVFSYYIRTIGITLFGGILLFLLFKRHWKMAAGYSLGIFALAFPWVLRNKLLGLENTYLNQLVMVNPYQPESGYMGISDVFTRVFNNIQRYISKEIPSGVLNVVDVDYLDTATVPALHWVYGIAAFALTGYGLYRLKENRVLLVSFFLGNFGILLLWPEVYFGARFMISLIPFFILLILVGLKDLVDRYVFQKYFNTGFHPLFMAGFLFLCLPRIKTLNMEANGVFLPEVVNYFKTAIWAKENTPKDAVISCRKPSLFALYSGRYVTGFKSTLDQNDLIKDLESRKADFVVLDALGYTSTSRYLYPVIKENPLMFPILHQESEGQKETYLMQFNRETEFKGQLIDGKKEGLGKITYLMGNEYEGELKNNKFHGKGKFLYHNGHVYEGDWVNGVREGQGVFTWAEGATYKGGWKNDGRHGFGVFTLPDGAEYRGDWKNDKRNGNGRYSWADKTVYDGPWVDDKRNGIAWLYLPNGTKYHGNWSNDMLNGEIKIYDSTGKLTMVKQFNNNKPVN